MDLNLYLGLPPLPRPPGRLGSSMDCPAPAVSPVPEAPRTDEEPAAPEEMPSPPVAYSPSDQRIDPMLVDWLDDLSTDSEDSSLDGGDPADAPSHDSSVSPPPPPALGSVSPVLQAPATDGPAGFTAAEEMLPLDSPLVDSPLDIWSIDHSLLGWLDGSGTDSEEGLDDAGEPAAAFDAPSRDAIVSSQPLLPLAGLEGVRLEWVERLSHPDQVAPVAGTEMVSTRRSVGGAIEEAVPELRLQRLIQVSEQHRIVRPGPVSRNQRATSPEADRLAQAIQRSHSSLDASRWQNLDSDGKMGGMGAVKKDGNCGGCNSSFECNICLDAAKEPVVTPCGHLFCWPCLYKWLHAHSVHSECPVCKGEVLEVNVTPIYGRGGGERDASSNDVPPRPSVNRSESLRQQLQTPDPRTIANMVRRLMGNQDHLRGQAAPPTGAAEVPSVPQGRFGVRRQQRPILASPSFNSPSPLTRLMRRNAAPETDNLVQLPSDNAAPAVPQQSSSVEQASTSSTVAAQSRRSRPPTEPTTTRRTRRRQQH